MDLAVVVQRTASTETRTHGRLPPAYLQRVHTFFPDQGGASGAARRSADAAALARGVRPPAGSRTRHAAGTQPQQRVTG